jgi:photosystem II stability/assembly factor-like uncharacterized protein
MGGTGTMKVVAACLAGLALLNCAAELHAQVPTSLAWRNIGPNRGGRSIAVAGSAARPQEYYFGATGGGLWKTTDAGTTWRPVTDGQIGSSSVGAVAVAASHPDIVYIGMGEVQLRGNVMQGDGVYKSADGGRTWQHMGLPATQAIGRIIVHPRNPDVVYVAALGHPYGRNPERGVYRSRDGGRSWQKILYRSDTAGAVDLALDPNDPNVLYATLWEVYRRPWLLWSGGPGSGMFKSMDGGDTWTELTRNPGMPAGVLGKMTVSVSGADSRRVYANIEAQEGGLHRSDDGGATWVRINGHRDLWQRSFYFLRVAADPKDRETVYVLSFELEKSTDGGRTFTKLRTPHVDHHDLWIDPQNPRRMINANDGGANVTVNGGETWTEQDYSTAQMYRVATTHEYPYHVCGGQQDNSTACVSSQGNGEEFYEVGGGENAVIAPDPGNADIFYATETNSLTRFDRATGLLRDVQPDPLLVMGQAARTMRERWNWTYPIVISPVDPQLLWAGSQHLWESRDEGRSWRRISGDLTRADSATMGDSGGPIILDQDGPEIYATIFSIAPSKHDVRTLWTGSDDGLVHVTRDGGQQWRNVTPPDLPAFTRISRIDVSAQQEGTAYVAGHRYQLDDRAPYIWKTKDFGRSWSRATNGIRGDDFVHVVRADPERVGLLYAGTEHGVYVSYDDGGRWHSLSLNLPDVQVIDLEVKGRDLVIATHGRGFYVLDDVTPLRRWQPATASAALELFAPEPAIRRSTPAVIDYYLGRAAQDVRIEVVDGAGDVVHQNAARVDALRQPGFHRVRWNLRYPGATVFPGIVLEGPNPAQGPWAPPGSYTLRVTADGATRTQPLRVLADPRLPDVTSADLRAQFELAMQIRDLTSAANEAVLQIRELRGRLPAGALADSLHAIEAELYQVRNQGPKDKIAFPIKLNNRLSGLRGIVERGDAAPTRAQERIFKELAAELHGVLGRLARLLGNNDSPQEDRREP